MEVGLVLRWLVAFLALFAVGLPLVATLCPTLTDRGAGVAIPAALVVVGFVAWVVGHVAFGWPAVLVGLTALLGASALAVYSGARPDPRLAVETALVFALAFFFLVAVRAVDPAVHPLAGEKFLDFSLLKALVRADRVPPLDPWFAGERAEYYYGGHMLAALLAKATFTAPRYAYNLSLAGFYAMLVTAAYGLAGSLADDLYASRTTAAALGALFVGFASNLATPVRAVFGVLPDVTVSTIAGLAGASAQDWGGSLTAPLSAFTYWSASRVIPGTINEFPLFAFLNGDLHAHMMSTPFMLLGATLAFSYFRTPDASQWRRRGLLALVSLDAALLAVVNTWSFPTVLGVAWLTVTFAPSNPLTLLWGGFDGRESSPLSQGRLQRLRRSLPGWARTELRWTGGAFVVAAVLTLLAVAASFTFWTGTASGRSVELVEDRSPLWGLLVVHGGFLLLFVPYLFGRARDVTDLTRWRTARLVAEWVGLTLIAAALGGAVFGLFVPLAIGAWLLLRARRAADLDTSFVTVLFLAAAGIVVLVDLVYLKEEAGPGRMNTVFKTYMQVWVLWAPAAGAALANLLARPTPAPSLASFASADRATFERLRPATVLAVLVVLGCSLYGGLAMADHFTAKPGYYDPATQEQYAQTDDPTLDALLFVSEFHADEAPAIEWLDEQPGQVVVASAPGWQTYRWTNPESSLTGHQSVAGWAHEIGYRGEETYRDRAADADSIFRAGPGRQATLLAQYDVDYIYVGPNERERYGDGVSFEEVQGVSVARQFDGVTVYAVDQSQLQSGNANGS